MKRDSQHPTFRSVGHRTNRKKGAASLLSRASWILIALLLIVGCYVGRENNNEARAISSHLDPSRLSLLLLTTTSSSDEVRPLRPEADTAIIMVDTRDLFSFDEANPNKIWYGQMTALNNHDYACKVCRISSSIFFNLPGSQTPLPPPLLPPHPSSFPRLWVHMYSMATISCSIKLRMREQSKSSKKGCLPMNTIGQVST